MQFSQIVGQEKLKQRLLHAAGQGRVSHAQLFLGREGSGALALAVGYAQYLNCLQPTEDDSCGTCSSCQKYQHLAHPDLHFSLPVASKKDKPITDWFINDWREAFVANPYLTLADWYEKIEVENKQGVINVAEAESIISKLNYKAYEGKYKVLIIWYAERMNVEAANKLLKLIEEPPAQTLLLLVAESADTMLKTILSRTQQTVVPPIEGEAIAKHLSEKLGIAHEQALTYAHLANGNYVEAQQMAQQSDATEEFFQKFTQLMRLCYVKRPDETLALLMWANAVTDWGREQQKQFLKYALHLVRENFALNLNITPAVYLAGKEADFSAKFSPFIHRGNVESIYEEMNTAYRQISANGNAKMIFTDMALQLKKHIKSL